MATTKKKSHVREGETQEELIARLKEEFLWYFRQLPIQKAAADSIGRDEDTILKWKKADPTFADACLKAKSDYALKHGKRKHDRILSRLYDDFRDDPVELKGDLNLNHDVKDGSALTQLITKSGFVPAPSGDHSEKG